MSEVECIGHEPQFAAFVGIDWQIKNMCRACKPWTRRSGKAESWSTLRKRLARIDKRQFPQRVGLYPYRQHKGRKLVLGDRTEALVYILAHELLHMHQQHGYAVHSSFPVGRVKNAHGKYSEVCTEAYAIHKLRAVRRKIYFSTAAAGGATPILGVLAATTLAAS